MTVPPPLPPRHPDELQHIFDRVCNWGRWGVDDRRGTLNHIDAAVRVAAARLVRTGRSYSFGQTIVPNRPGSASRTRDITPAAEAARTVRDDLTIAPHGFATTHVDALGHCFFNGYAYNGRTRDEVVQEPGLRLLDISDLAEGVVTRGVLLDLVTPGEVLPPGTAITPDDLQRAADRAGLVIARGDAVLVRSGRTRPGGDGDGDGPERTGLLSECLEWFHDRDVAVFGGDCVDVAPSPHPGHPDHFHEIALAGMGLVLLDLPDVEALGAAVDEQRSAEFLLTVAPLRVRHATGSPVNPVATF